MFGTRKIVCNEHELALCPKEASFQGTLPRDSAQIENTLGVAMAVRFHDFWKRFCFALWALVFIHAAMLSDS